MLKNVNREYSATLRAHEGEERAVRLEGLKQQRIALMSSIAELRGLRGAPPSAWQGAVLGVQATVG